jgi:hypothetical protein
LLNLICHIVNIAKFGSGMHRPIVRFSRKWRGSLTFPKRIYPSCAIILQVRKTVQMA